MSVTQISDVLAARTVWPLDRVKDHAVKIGSGVTPSGGAASYLDDGIPLLRSQNVHSDGLRLDDVAYIAEDTHEEMSGTKLKEGDVLLNITGASIGRCTYVPAGFGEGNVNQHVCIIRPTPGLDYRFLAYCLTAPWGQDQILSSFTGASRQGLGQRDLGGIQVPLPPLNEQKRIAAYLDASCAAIDGAVAAKRRQVETLQALRLSTITQVVTVGLKASAKRKGSDTSWFLDPPSHWRIERLKDVVSKFVDYRGKTPEKTTEGIPLVTARNIRGGRIDFSGSQEYISEDDYDDWMVRGFPEQGDVLVTTEAPMGEVASVEDTQIALAQRIVLLKTRSAEMSNDYLRYFLLSAAGSAEIRRYATGSTALGIKARWLKIISVLVPPVEEQTAIARYLDDHCKQVEPLIQRIEEQIETLVAYRKSLIHECVTGQRRVTEADLKHAQSHA